MAKSATRRARLTALAALMVAVALALLNPSGPFQPFTVILGWLAVVVLALALLAGFPRVVALAAFLEVIRAALSGVAGDQPLSAGMWALLVYSMIDLASSSFAERRHALGWRTVVLRATGGGAVAYGVVWLAGAGVGSGSLTGDVWALVGLVAAFGVAGIMSFVAQGKSPQT